MPGRPSKTQLMEWLKPVEPDTEELELANQIQTGEYEIYLEKLESILEEARDVFTRIGISSFIHGGDLIVGIYSPKGDLLCGSMGTFLHAVTAQLPLKYIINVLTGPGSNVELKAGDMYYVNEALYGGIHNPDQILYMPIFYGDEVVAWAAAATHECETGATEPGGVTIKAITRHDEGMKLAPFKIGENYKIRDDLDNLMINFMSRNPRMQQTDIRARASAADRIRIRLTEVIDQKGTNFIKGVFRRMLRDSETAVRQRISELVDGKFRSVVFLDTNGIDEGLYRVVCEARKSGDKITFDFTGTSPDNEGSYNAFPWIAAAHAAVYIYGYLFHDLPVTSSSYAPFEWIIPEGTCLNAEPEAAVCLSVGLCTSVMTLMPYLFARMMYSTKYKQQIGGSDGNTGASPAFAGIDQYGSATADMHPWDLNTEGQGARVDRDGVNSFGFAWCPYGKAWDVEDVENQYPQLHLGEKHRRDSAGPGKYRGGVGTQNIEMVHKVPFQFFNNWSMNSRIHKNQGLFGGYPPHALLGINIKNTNVLQLLQEKGILTHDVLDIAAKKSIEGEYNFHRVAQLAEEFHEGDIFISMNSGGDGYGDVLERDPEAVVEDVKHHWESDWRARNLYAISYDPDTFQVNYEETEQLRKQVREERLKNAVSYDEFIQSWSQKKPPESALRYYGAWPTAEKNRIIVRV